MNEEDSLKNLPNPGALLDTRPEEERNKDYKFAEVVSAIEPVVWVEKLQEAWRKFPIFSQNGSGSCVAQTLRKLYGVYMKIKTGVWVDISASHIYQRRINKPAPGMGGVDAFEIARKGTTLEQFAPSENLTDQQMDDMKVVPFTEKIGETFKIGNYITISPPDFETVASIIQKTGKAVMVWFYFQADEWNNMPSINNPNLVRGASSTLRHSVSAVDFTLYQGKKALIIDDSWGLSYALNGQRIITEEFFNKRCFFAAYFQNFAFEEASVQRPRYDGSVVSLQNCLKFEGVFPLNVDSTGVFGPVTTKAVKDFQKKYGIDQVGFLGPVTKAKLKELYP